MWMDVPWRLKRKSSLFIELDIECDWVHHIKWPHIDKGQGQMGMMGSDVEDGWDDAIAQYQVDIHQLADSNESIAQSFKALVILLLECLPALGSKGWESADLEEEAELEDAEG